MTTADTVYTWIMHYACKHRIEDLISDFFKNVEEKNVTKNIVSKIPNLYLNQALIWLLLTNEGRDSKMAFGSVIATLDFMLEKATMNNSLELFIRLSVGLKLKDLVHNLHLHPCLFVKKLELHFPQRRFEMKTEYLTQVFSDNELLEFEGTIWNVCHYLCIINSSASESNKLSKNFKESEFGTALTESLKTVVIELFEQFFQSEPLCVLEQRVFCKSEQDSHESKDYWDTWLTEKLSGIQELTPDIVRQLLIDLNNESESYCEVSNSYTGSRCMLSVSDKDSSDSESFFVPSSQGNELNEVPETVKNRKRKNREEEEPNTPNLKKFIKQKGVKGCIIRIDKI